MRSSWIPRILCLLSPVLTGCSTGPDPESPPTPPSGLSATAVSASRIDLSWTDNSSDETGFSIEACTGAGCNGFAQVASVNTGVITHSVTTLAAGTTYRYRVRASGSGQSAPSNVAEATTLPLAPSSPTGVVATASSGNQITVTWADNSPDETGFLIQRCTGLGCSGFAALASVGPNVVSYQDASAAVGVVYGYRVAAVNLGGTSNYSAPVEAVIQVPPPPAPSNLVATASTTAASITLGWTDNSTSETQFQIERCQGVGCVNFASVGFVGADVVSFANPGLTAGTTYRYRVAASNGGGASGFSNVAEAATLPILVVPLPAGPATVTVGGQAVFAVFVLDGAGGPVEGATVNVTASGLVAPASVLTNSAGLASVVLSPISPGVVFLTFVVSKVGYLSPVPVTRVLTVLLGP